ncbi:MAG: permease-like cell division protein FtsX [Tidjanibacter sp.]|nr:permease-like cell division protein FtsX [Tidjanibacter sp.]
MNNRDNRRLRRKVRSSYAISTVSIALVLFLTGGVGYILANLVRASDRMREKVTLYVMLDNRNNDTLNDQIGKELRSRPEVLEAVYVPKAKAAADFASVSGEDFESFLKFNPLPDSYEVRLKASMAGKTDMTAFVGEIEAIKGVDEVVYQRSVVDSIGTNLNKFNLVMVLFGAALLLISLILLNNTIRVSVFSRRTLINTMKLVGATRGFIKRPFLIDAVWQGLIAAVVASLMFWGMVVGLNEGLPYVMLLTGLRPILMVSGGMVVAGVLLSVLFTDLSLNKFIKMNVAKIYLY